MNNCGLEEGEKIKFIGVDVQHQIETGVYYMSQLLSEREIPTSIYVPFTTLKNFSHYDGRLYDLSTSLKQCVEEHVIDTQDYLGDDYTEFIHALDNIFQAYHFYDVSNHAASYREQQMISNFEKYYQSKNTGKFVGFFGVVHVYLNDESSGEASFGAIINRTDTNKNKVASIHIQYYQGKYMNRTNTKKNSKIQGNHLSKLWGKNVSYNYAFCRLDFDDSPFVKPSSQYVILVKNATPSTLISL